MQEIQELCNDLSIQIAEVSTEAKEELAKNNTASEGREKLLEAKIEDLGDRLRLGMGKLQQAIGESSEASASVNGKLANIDVSNYPNQGFQGGLEKGGTFGSKINFGPLTNTNVQKVAIS